MTKVTEITDNELFLQCQTYGNNARIWMRKFAGLLPEVKRRFLYKKRGFGSIHEFAARLAGMSSYLVDKVFRLDKKLEDKPILRALLVDGEQGWSKIEQVAFIATPKTDRMWAAKVQILSKAALAKYIQGIRKQDGKVTAGGEAHEVEWNRLSFPVSPEIESKMRLLKQRLEKQKKQAVTWNEVLKALLGGVEDRQETTQRIVKICPDCEQRKANESEEKGEVKRPIPAIAKHIVSNQFKKLCAYPGCRYPAEIFHHPDDLHFVGTTIPTLLNLYAKLMRELLMRA